jgi:hypothetical protein
MKKRNNKYIKLGIFLMVFSGVFFAATLIIPFFDLPTKTKVIASTTSFVLMEVVFWLGGLLVGKELFTRYKKKLDPRNWFRKKDDRIEEPETITEESAGIKESGSQPKP